MRNIWLTCVLILVALPVFSLDGPLAQYRFEGNLDDQSGNVYHLWSDGGIDYENQISGKAAFFTGAVFATREEVPGETQGLGFGQGDFSLSLLFNPEPVDDWQVLFDNRGMLDGVDGMSLGISVYEGRMEVIELALSDSEENLYFVPLENNWATMQWYHLVVTYDEAAGLIRMYLDGDMLAEEPIGPLSIDEDYGFTLGATHLPPQDPYAERGGFFFGYLDNVVLFDHVLSESERLGLGNAVPQVETVEHHVDFVGETAGASHQMGYFFLDIDTNHDGIPNFLQVGPEDDLDGDSIPNELDDDDDGDGIPDEWDSAGYHEYGPLAGYAPYPENSTPAHYFEGGEAAEQAGHHPDDYWQFVPNGTYEQNDQPYEIDGLVIENYYLDPAAWLFVDEYAADGANFSDGIPDVLQKSAYGNSLPPMATDSGHITEHVSGLPFPGLLDGELGETIFYLCDDDSGTSTNPIYRDNSPYVDANGIQHMDEISARDGNLDYPIYGTQDEELGQIPEALLQDDARGERLWRYRWQGQPVPVHREIVYFLNTYWHLGENPVSTYYTKTVLNPDLAESPMEPVATTSGQDYGLDEGMGYQDLPLPTNWFPRYGNTSDHNMLAQSVYGFRTYWYQIATFGYEPKAIGVASQDWLDRWENMTDDRQIVNYLSLEAMMADANVQDLLAERYGILPPHLMKNELVRAEQYHLPHALITAFPEATQPGYLISWEDLFGGGDRSYNDLIFYSSVGARVEAGPIIIPE